MRTLAATPDILSRFVVDLHKCGLIGEDHTAKLIYLALTSRVLPKLISFVVKGQSSAGKSHTVETVTRFFPESAVYKLTAMSDKALVHSEESLVHRFLLIYEAVGLPQGFATYGIRSLLSEGCLSYDVSEQQRDGAWKTVKKRREGPTGFITTTTELNLHPENETRLLSVSVNDSAEQTAAVLREIARREEEEEEEAAGVDFAPWIALQEWIQGNEPKVLIPYATMLADAIPPVATRLRRDIAALFNLIKAHALLHRGTREVSEKGSVIATLDDYAAVRELTLRIFSEGVKASVPRDVRETVEAVRRIVTREKAPVSLTRLEEEMGLDKSNVSRRVKKAMEDDYLVNDETKQGMPMQLRLGQRQLPEDDLEVLPRVDQLRE